MKRDEGSKTIATSAPCGEAVLKQAVPLNVHISIRNVNTQTIQNPKTKINLQIVDFAHF